MDVERAIRKGVGELGGSPHQEMIYEGYAPGGVALVVEAATDHRNRTADLRSISSKNGGSLSSLRHRFPKKGQFTVLRALMNEDRILEWKLGPGAEDVTTEAHATSFSPCSTNFTR